MRISQEAEGLVLGRGGLQAGHPSDLDLASTLLPIQACGQMNGQADRQAQYLGSRMRGLCQA